MSVPRQFNECRECGELNRRSNRLCAMCGAELDPEVVSTDPPSASREDQATAIVLIIAVAVVWIGLTLAAPGLGIFLAILSVVPFLRTVAVLNRRQERGSPTSLLTSVFMFLGSLGTAFVVLTVVLITAVGTFCAVCLTGAAFAAPDARPFVPTVLVAISALIALGAVAVIGYPLSKWIRNRWQRDVGDDVPRR